MEQQKPPASPKKEKGRPPLRRGQLRNKIIMDFFKSLAALGRPTRMNGGGGSAGSGTTTPTSSSADNSEGTSDS